MEVPLLGKTYALGLLQILGRGRSTFTGLLDELKISRTTLTKTLKTLVEEGYVHRESVGKYVIYRITEKGLDVLEPDSRPRDALMQKLGEYVVGQLEVRGLLEKYDIDKKELSAEVWEQARIFLDELADRIENSLGDVI
jgi:DNA-binding MarR family transcriptional regulator